MRVSPGTWWRRLPRLTAVVAVLLSVLLLVPAAVGPPSARAQGAGDVDQLRQEQQQVEESLQDAREAQAGAAAELEGAARDREAVEAALAEATAAVDEVLGEIDRVRGEQAALRQEVERLQTRADETRQSLAAQIRALYIQGAADDVVLAFRAEQVTEVSSRSHYLTALSRADRGQLERLDVVTTELGARQEELAAVDERLAGLRAEAETRQAELDRQLFIAAGIEADVAPGSGRGRVRGPPAGRAGGRGSPRRGAGRGGRAAGGDRRRRGGRPPCRGGRRRGGDRHGGTRPARLEPADAGGSTGGTRPGPDRRRGAAAPVTSSGMACPQDNPRSFTDTWGAPRSGGRSHQGTDIFGARGGDVFAITAAPSPAPATAACPGCSCRCAATTATTTGTSTCRTSSPRPASASAPAS
jgi:peptidoglycan LD-endopeptidase LytH